MLDKALQKCFRGQLDRIHVTIKRVDEDLIDVRVVGRIENTGALRMVSNDRYVVEPGENVEIHIG